MPEKKTGGQVAYEAFWEAHHTKPPEGPWAWAKISPKQQANWETAALAVLASEG